MPAPARRLLRLALHLVLGLLATVAVAVAAIAFFLGTPQGGDLLRRQAVAWVNQSIAGRIDVGRVRFAGSRIVLRDVALRTPEGALVAAVPRIEVMFRPLALFRRHLDLVRLEIERPELLLVSDRRGLNVGRALAPRVVPRPPPPGAPPTPPPALAVTLRALALDDGRGRLTVVAEPVAPGTVGETRIEDVDVRGEGRFDLGRLTFVASGRVEARLVAPYAAPLVATFEAQAPGPQRRSATVDATLGPNRLRARVQEMGAGRTAVAVDEARISPDLVQLFAPALPLAASLGARGAFTVRGPRVEGEIEAEAAGGEVRARGSVDLVRRWTPGLVVTGSDIDLAGLFEGGPRSRLGFRLEARGGGRRLEAAQGDLALDMAPARLGSGTFGPVRLRARAAGGVVELETLIVTLPGLVLDAAGRLGSDRLSLRTRVAIADLAAAARPFSRLEGADLPEVDGRGEVRLALSGPPRHPRLDAQGRFASLRIGGARARALAFALTVPRIDRALAGSADAQAARLRLGGHLLLAPRLRLASRPDRRFDASASVAGPQRLAITARGRWAPGLQSLALHRLAISYPEARWGLERPARLFPGPERVAVEGLRLASGEQRIALDVRAVGRHLAGRLAVERLDAAALPAGLLPPAAIAVGLRAIDLVLETAPAGPTRLDGKALLSGRPVQLRAETPASLGRLLALGPRRLARLPVKLEASADALPLAALARLRPGAPLTGGTLSARIAAEGSLLRPSGTTRLSIAGARGPRIAATDVLLEARLPEATRLLEARLTLRRGARALVAAEGTLQVPSGRLPDVQALAAAPIALRARLGPIRFQRLAPSAGELRAASLALTGRLEGELRLEGSLRDPDLRLAAAVDGARLGTRPVGQGELRAEYRDRRAQAQIRLASANGGTLRASGSAPLDLAHPRYGRGLDPRDIPVDATLEADRFDLSGLSGLGERVGLVAGIVSGKLTVAGPLRAPRTEGRLEWSGGRLHLTALGRYEGVHLLIHGDQRAIVLEDLSARSGGGGIRVAGRALRRSDEGWRVLLRADAARFPIYAGGQALATTTARIDVDGLVTSEQANLTARIPEARLALVGEHGRTPQPLERPPDVVLLRDGRPIDRIEARKLRALAAARAERAGVVPPRPRPLHSRRVPLRVAIEAPHNIWLTGPDVALEVGLSPDFTLTVSDEPRVFGAVEIRRGHVEVLTRRFELERGSQARFSGPTRAPTLLVRARHEARKAETTIVAVVEGTPPAVRLRLISPDHPEYGDAELFTILATGRLPDERGGSVAAPSARAASLVGGLAASRLQRLLARRLPLDVLSIEPGEGVAGTRLEAGTYLTHDLYVAYVGRVGTDPFRRQNRNEVQLEYQISRRWSVEATYGDARQGSADLLWTRHY